MFDVNFNIWGNKDEDKIVASILTIQGSDGSIFLNPPVSIPSNQPIRTIDTNQKTYVISHGFTNTGGNQGNNYAASLSEIAKALRSQPENANANIIVVDWEQGAKAQGIRGYVIPAENTREAGNLIAQFLIKQDIDPSKTELIGHSLGGQVSGFAGAKYKELTGKEIDRITALDPAAFGVILPLDSFDRRLTWKTRFNQPALDDSAPLLQIVESAPPSGRLDPDDAKRVVVLHTSNVLGTDELIGDLDFFVNPNTFLQPGKVITISDNHGYATELYTQLIKGNAFPQSDGSTFNYSRLKSPETGKIDVDTTKVLFEGSTSGTFDNGQNKKILGDPADGDSESYVQFYGRGSDGQEFSNDQEFSRAKGISTASDIPFSLGNLTYRNGLTVFGSEPEGDFPLNVTLSLTNPVPNTQTFNFPFNLTATENTGDPVKDADILRFSDSGISQQIIKFPGSTAISGYKLELVGFSTDDGKTKLGRFNTPEQRLSDALLIGKIKPVSILEEAVEGTIEGIKELPGNIKNKIGQTVNDFNGRVATFNKGLLDGLSTTFTDISNVLSPPPRVAQELKASAEQNLTFQITEAVMEQYPGGILGTESNDKIIGSPATDVVLAAEGADTIEGASGGDYLLGLKGNDRILGDDGNDIINGNEGDDFILGGVDDDLVRGGKANDQIFGDDGEDILIADRGTDRLTGGGGSDIFILRTDTGIEETNAATADWLLDFNASEGDLIGINGGVPIDILTFTPTDVNQDGIADTIIQYTETNEIFGVYTNIFGVVINTQPDIVKNALFTIPLNDPIIQIG
jgi:hypothetical protein